MVLRRVGAPRIIGSWTAPALLVVSAATLVVTACSIPGRGPETDLDASDSADNLAVDYLSESVACDGTPSAVAVISGAEPGEVLAFTSTLPISVPDAVADAEGRHQLSWSCNPDEARLRWTLVVTGRTSGRSGTVAFGGADTLDREDILAFTPTEEPTVCNGELNPLGTVSGGRPDEELIVTSAHTGTVSHRADGLGEVPLFWRCRPDEATAWEVTVDSAAGDRSLRFMVTGVAPDPAELPSLAVELTENPFACDGRARAFATITNLNPFERVTFTANSVDELADGTADENGALPIRWQCNIADVGTTWDLTAYGVDSGRSVTVSFTAGPADSGTAIALTVTVAEEPFVCDGQSRAFATIGNLVPNEFVDFSSPDAANLRQGQANNDGLLPIRWQCDPEDDGRVWSLTATGRSSGRTVTLVITGVRPS